MIFDRREFLKAIGIIGGSAAISCNRMAPEEKLSAYLSPPAEMIPGVPAYYATICRACPAGCGILVKTREGRPIKLEGNPAHPINQGKLCARGQAFIQGLYNRNRATEPLLRKNGKLTPVSWEEALLEVSAKMGSARSTGFLTGLESGTFEELMQDLLRGFSGEHLNYSPLSQTSMAAAAELLFGKFEVPRIDLSLVHQIVSFGADFLDTWLSPVEFSRQWAKSHSVSMNRRLQVDYVGPRRNLTANAADRFYRASSGDVDALVLGLAHEVFEKKRPLLSGHVLTNVETALRALGPKPRDLSIPQKTLQEMAKRLTSSKIGLILYGGSEVLGSQATMVNTAVLLTNHMLRSVGPAIRFGEQYALTKSAPAAKVIDTLESNAKGDLETLFIYGSNPAYLFPNTDFSKNWDKSKGYTVALSSELDETAQIADAVLPVHHPLESWGDYDLNRHIKGLMQPVRAPLHETRHFGDVLIDIGKRAGRKMKHASYKDYLVGKWATEYGTPEAVRGRIERATGSGPGLSQLGEALETGTPSRQVLSERKWEQMLVHGGRFEPIEKINRPYIEPVKSDLFTPIGAKKDRLKDDLDLIVPFSVLLFDGGGTTKDWLREVPDPLTQTAWEIPVEVSPDVAKSKGLKDGDIVKLKSQNGEINGRAIIESGLVANSVALRPGGGRERALEQDGTGNVYALLGQIFDTGSGEMALAGTKVTIEKVKSDRLVSVMGSPYSEGRLLALSMGLNDYRERRFPVITRHGEIPAGEHHDKKIEPVLMPHQEKGGERPADNMYSLQEHAKHRWGLVVDLDRCSGCSACAVACYAENNIPVVGRDEVSKGRELSWIRIEKHLFGRGERERVRFLPVMCQQCDNAPCETVCPVFAASHTTDGLNAQIYNRCIGTRYCSNNCPYKVRRFNYFDYKREKPANQQLNPDVTVRSRGVMEKCTFCIQRIREVQNKLQVSGKALKDGQIVPACVQTCPTGALTFGDFKQQRWDMSELARDPRGYRLLDYVSNTRPGVVYLRKVDTEEEETG